ncbi:hypothetical protein Sp245p_13840 [Azospirillum baldaniorum]|uniref:Uncharacterized protein n=1 Tax=Azospirillum baldaniorum TaxID=1064539 RepID=A0A9P1JNW5_9PROT|nr:hypothetical protein [Azospirillum baldaniorum]AWJ90796.1 hypothetical protein Sp245p_13840 [Azospirillum baldaniorum]TWA79026.1 hypothetical protein FBZ85_105332 [Azospirillum brasilense]CCC96968.1 protein of unknown function [Azospirillum baldaniorum]
MNDRIMPTPRNPFTEAHKAEMEETARRAEEIYGSPDAQEVTEANKALKEQARGGGKAGSGRLDSEGPGADPVVTGSVRKPG